MSIPISARLPLTKNFVLHTRVIEDITNNSNTYSNCTYMYMYVYTYLNASLCTYVHVHILSKYTHVCTCDYICHLVQGQSRRRLNSIFARIGRSKAKKPKDESLLIVFKGTAGCKEMDVEGNTMEEYYGRVHNIPD